MEIQFTDHQKVQRLSETNTSKALESRAKKLQSSIDFHFSEVAYNGDNGLHTTAIMVYMKELVEVKGALFLALEREAIDKKQEDEMWEKACKG